MKHYDTDLQNTVKNLRFSVGGTFINTTRIVPTDIIYNENIYIWAAPVACRAVSVRGYQIGGVGGVSVSAARNNDYLSAYSLSVGGQNTWYTTSSLQNTDFSIGDKLKIFLTGWNEADSITQLAIQVDFVTL